MTHDVAHEIILKCPKHKGIHKSPLDIQTHLEFLERRLAASVFLERQRVLDVVFQLGKKVDLDNWCPDSAELLSQAVKLIDSGAEGL